MLFVANSSIKFTDNQLTFRNLKVSHSASILCAAEGTAGYSYFVSTLIVLPLRKFLLQPLTYRTKIYENFNLATRHRIVSLTELNIQKFVFFLISII